VSAAKCLAQSYYSDKRYHCAIFVNAQIKYFKVSAQEVQPEAGSYIDAASLTPTMVRPAAA